MSASDIVLVVAATGAALVSVVTAWRAGRIGHAVNDVHKETDKQTKQLENITFLVDGRYSEVLKELADVKALLATKTGRADDATRADQALIRYEEQEARVQEAKAKEIADGKETSAPPIG